MRLLTLILLSTLTFSLVAQEEVLVDSTSHIKITAESYDTANYTQHEVELGETAFSLKNRYSITLAELYNLNPGAENGIALGEILVFPKKDPNAAPTTPKLKAGEFIYHIVKPREGFFAIAKLYKISIADIQQANPQITTLHPGDRLIIPFDTNAPQQVTTPSPTIAYNSNEKLYTAKPKETIWGISHRFNITEEALIKANPALVDGLKVGQVILIPDENSFASQEAEVVMSEEERQELEASNAGYHTVKDGENLYLIAKMYATPISYFLEINPGLSLYPETGKLILLPEYTTNFNFIEHRSTEREKLTTIAFNYQVNLNALKALNPNISKRTAKGAIVFIPIEKISVPQPIDSVELAAPEIPAFSIIKDSLCNTQLNTETTFNVVLMLPLNGNQIDSTTFENMAEKKSVNAYPCFNYIQFLEGAKLAVDSLASSGMSINLFAFDVSRDIKKTKELLKNPIVQEADLIIGLLYSQTFTIVSNYANAHGIPLVNAISKRESIIKNAPFVFKVEPTEDQLPLVALSLLPNDQPVNIILSRADKYRESIRMDYLRKELANWKAERPGQMIHIKETNYMNDSIMGVISAADNSCTNYIITISEDELFAMELLRATSEFSDSLQLNMIGYPNWDQFTNLESDYMEQVNLHIISSQLVDYKEKSVQKFLTQFRAQFNAEPNSYAFSGYDIAYYFTEALGFYGSNLMNCIRELHYTALQNSFEFQKNSSDGFENRHWNIYTIENRTLIPIKNHAMYYKSEQ